MNPEDIEVFDGHDVVGTMTMKDGKIVTLHINEVQHIEDGEIMEDSEPGPSSSSNGSSSGGWQQVCNNRTWMKIVLVVAPQQQ